MILEGLVMYCQCVYLFCVLIVCLQYAVFDIWSSTKVSDLSYPKSHLALFSTKTLYLYIVILYIYILLYL